MIAKLIAPNVYAISLGFVNVFLLDTKELTLIDTGVPGSTPKIIRAIRELGRQPEDLRHILVTHLHFDHTGSLAELQRISKGQAYMHPLDAELYLEGEIMRRPIESSPNWITKMIVKRINAGQPRKNTDIGTIEHFITGGEELPAAGGVRAVYTPGHTVGHIAYYLPNQSIFFAGDAASNMFRLGYSILYEDFSQGQHTLGEIAKLGFNRACFSHGKAIEKDAARKFAHQFGS
jgi:glyoxylase-like metal-dependent hydrolase (beta-lactamase superfamily II)